ncbi:MAG: DUF1595 domain-containing protein [Verrucomicrobia bacterium]|nr:DUF1595 domain-containing protein [Verrucomicrobiota bacterium]
MRELTADFTTRAFHGTTPDAAFVDGLVQVYEKRRARGDSHKQALKESLSIVLAAPGFLYFAEPAQPGMADLHAEKTLAEQVDRMLASPKSRAC